MRDTNARAIVVTVIVVTVTIDCGSNVNIAGMGNVYMLIGSADIVHSFSYIGNYYK